MTPHSNSLWRLLWQQLAGAIAAWRRYAQDRAEFGALDAHALRDLGLDRSELDSYGAEWRGDAQETRRRVAAGPRASVAQRDAARSGAASNRGGCVFLSLRASTDSHPSIQAFGESP